MDKNKSIEILNRARSMELRAIHQYMVQHYHLDSLGDQVELAAYMKLIAIDEMRHAEKFAERIRKLDGVPTTKLADEVKPNQSIQQIYPFDADLESNTVNTYKELMSQAEKNNDQETADLFKSIIKEEEIHLHYYEDTAKKISE